MSEYDVLLDAPASSAVSPYDALLDEPAPATAPASPYDALLDTQVPKAAELPASDADWTPEKIAAHNARAEQLRALPPGSLTQEPGALETIGAVSDATKAAALQGNLYDVFTPRDPAEIVAEQNKTPLQNISEGLQEPIVHIPTPEVTGPGTGFLRGAANLVEGLSSPMNLALIPFLGGAPGIVKGAAGVGFGVPMVKHAISETLPAALGATSSGEAVQNLVEGLGGLAMATGALGAGRPKKGGASETVPRVGSEDITANAIKTAVDTDVQKILTEPVAKTAAETVIPPETPLPGVPPEAKPVVAPKAPVVESPTGIRNAIVDQERVTRGLPERMEPLKRTFGKLWDEAMAKADQDAQAGAKLVKSIEENPRPLEDWESALLAHEQVNRQNAFDRAVDEVNAAPDEATKIDAQARLDRARDDVQLVYDVGQRVGTKSGQSLAARKLLVNKDYTLARMEAETRAVANEGKPLSEQQLAEVKTLHDRIAETEKKLAQYEEREQVRGSYEAFETLLTEQRHEAIQSAKLGKTITTFFDEQAAKARERIIARRGKLNVTVDPLNVAGLVDEAIIGASHIARGVSKFADWSGQMVHDFGPRIRPFLADLFERAKQFHETNAAAFQDTGRKKGPKKPAIQEAQENAAAGKVLDPKLVYDLAREKVNAGVQNLDSVIKAVHADLLKVHEGLTEREVRDAFSGYGKTKFPSKEADLAKLRELRRLGQLVSAIEDAQRKEAPKKTGLQRDPPTQAIRDKLKELQKAMRENGIETLYPEQQLATANQARATALRNQIEDIDRQLRTGEQPPKGKPVPDTPEVERLRSERDAMKTQLEEIEEAAHPRQTPEERALESAMKAAKKSIERYDEMLKSGNLRPAPNGPRAAPTPELEALQAERNALRDAVNEMRRDEAPRTPPEELARKNALKALYKSISEYDRRLKEGDFTPHPRRPGIVAALSEIVALRAQRDAMRDLFQKLKKAAETTRTPDEIQLARDKAAITRRTAKLREKIAASDYSRPEKRAPVMDAEKTRLLFENRQAKELYQKNLFEAELKKRTLPQKVSGTIAEVFHTIRALMTGGEFSGLLRQGKFALAGRPITTVKGAAPAMFKAFTSEKAEFAEMQKIQSRDNAELYHQSGLAIHNPRNFTSAQLEGNYRSRWANKIPLIAGSGRAYTVFLNRLRADVFDVLAATLTKRTGGLTPAQAKVIATYVNENTGAGSLGVHGQKAVGLLNATFFAPKYVMSRFQMLVGHSLWKGDGHTRRLIAEEYARIFTGMAVMYSLYSIFRDEGDPEPELDPRSGFFGKIRTGLTTIDPMAGVIQATVFLSRMFSGETKTERGALLPLRMTGGKKVPFGKRNLKDVIFDFGRSKLSPIPAAGLNEFLQEDFNQEPLTVTSRLAGLAPMTYGTIFEAMKAHQVPEGIALSILAFFGEGINTHAKKRTQRTISDKTLTP